MASSKLQRAFIIGWMIFFGGLARAQSNKDAEIAKGQYIFALAGG